MRWIWGGVGGFAALVLAYAFWATGTHPKPAPPQLPSYGPIDGIPCQTGATVKYQAWTHLDIYIEGKAMQIPANTGVYATGSTTQCQYWLTTSDTTGVIATQAPAKQQFTLGNFFNIWGVPLAADDLAGHQATASQSVRAYVNGKAYSGNPASIPLTNNAEIVLEYGPPWTTPPASYAFPKGE